VQTVDDFVFYDERQLHSLVDERVSGNQDYCTQVLGLELLVDRNPEFFGSRDFV
jgi:hypothetical protein